MARVAPNYHNKATVDDNKAFPGQIHAFCWLLSEYLIHTIIDLFESGQNVRSQISLLVFHFYTLFSKGAAWYARIRKRWWMAGGQEKWIQSVGEMSCDKCLKNSVIYSRKSALADNISSLSSGGGGGGASNPALGMGEIGIQYLFHDSDRSSGALKLPLFLERKVDQLDQRLGQQESSNRAILEQIMKIQQEFKVTSSIMQATKCFELWYKVEMKKYGQIMAEEKSQRISMSQSLNGIHRFLWTLFTWNTMKGPWGNWKIWMKEWG